MLSYVHGQATILISESTVPLKIPFLSQSFLVPTLHPLPSPVRILCTPLCSSHPLYMSPVPPSLSLSAPCTPTVTPGLLLSPLVHVSVTPVSHLHPLHGRWLLGEVLCSLYIITLAVTNHET